MVGNSASGDGKPRHNVEKPLLLTEKVVGMLRPDLTQPVTLILIDDPDAQDALALIDRENINNATTKDEVRAIKEAYEVVRAALFRESRAIIEKEVGDPLYKALMYLQMHPRDGQEFPTLSSIIEQYATLEPYQQKNLSAMSREVHEGADIFDGEHNADVERLKLKLDWLERVQEVCGEFDGEYHNICEVAKGRY